MTPKIEKRLKEVPKNDKVLMTKQKQYQELLPRHNSIIQDLKYKQSVINIHIKMEKRQVDIQTDNEFEFTNRLSRKIGREKKTMFEDKLKKESNVSYIKCIHTRHNEKVERSHRKAQERFYYEKIFMSLED